MPPTSSSAPHENEILPTLKTCISTLYPWQSKNSTQLSSFVLCCSVVMYHHSHLSKGKKKKMNHRKKESSQQKKYFIGHILVIALVSANIRNSHCMKQYSSQNMNLALLYMLSQSMDIKGRHNKVKLLRKMTNMIQKRDMNSS